MNIVTLVLGISAIFFLTACDDNDRQAPLLASIWQGTWAEDERPNDAFLVIDGSDVFSFERTVLSDTSVCYEQIELSDLVIDDSVFHYRQVIESTDFDGRAELAEITGVFYGDNAFPIQITRVMLIEQGVAATAIHLTPSAYIVFDNYYTEEDTELSVAYTESVLQLSDFQPLCN